MADDTLYLVDASGFIFRAYHALPPLTTKAGVPSGAVYGFASMLIKLEQELRPSHLAIIFDKGAKSFRDALYADYKAHRPDPPDDLKPQFGMVRKVSEAFGLPPIEADNFEADDLIATLARRARDAGLAVVVVSSDKDLMQLVGPGCVLLDTMKDPPKTYDPDAVKEKFGVPPALLGDVLALMGDSVDNVPGVPGVGPKTATALINHFGSLDAMLARSDEIAKIPGLRGAASVQVKIQTHAEQARLSRKLVALDENVDVPLTLESLRRHEPDMARIEALLREFEFGRLLSRMKPKGAESPPPATAQLNLTAAAPVPVAVAVVATTPTTVGAPVLKQARIISDQAALDALVLELGRAGALGISVESSGGSPLTAAIVGIALAPGGDAAPAYIPLAHRYLGAPHQLDLDPTLKALAPLLSAATPTKYVYDYKSSEILLGRRGAALARVACDPMIASYLLDPAADHELHAIAERRLGVRIESRAAVCGSGKKANAFDTIEVARAATFAGAEAELTLALGVALNADLRARDLLKLQDEMELPLAHVLAIMEPHGICLDVPMLRALSARVEAALGTLEDEVRTLSGSDVNLGSPKQLQELLFDKLGLPPTKKTKTGFSVDAEVLEELAPLHPVAAKILEHRTLSKLKGTYLDALPQLVDPRSGRLHTSYEQTIAATGRLSSVDPNLQNVPIRTELGQEIRRAFRAAPGCKLVVADYSQIELRVLAHLSQDEVLTDAFKKGQDIHQRTVIEMFGETRRDEPELRRVAKMINYGIVYGLSDFGLAQRLGIERADARRYIDGYNKTYAGLTRYMDRIIADAYRDGGARTLFGRFRPLPELASKNRNTRMYGERMARNTPVQGTAADLLKLAMIAVQQHLDANAPDVKMLLTVHDELVLEAPAAKAEPVGADLLRMMEQVRQLDVPLVVDLGIGDTWAEAK